MKRTIVLAVLVCLLGRLAAAAPGDAPAKKPKAAAKRVKPSKPAEATKESPAEKPAAPAKEEPATKPAASGSGWIT